MDTLTQAAEADALAIGGGRASANLEGRLGALDIALAALAYAGPLAGTAGYVALLIGEGNGLGAPLAFFSVMTVLALFAIGYGKLAKHVPNPGAFYAYITAGLGRAAGLGSSFLLMTSYLSVGIGCYAFSGLAAEQLVLGLGGPAIPWWVYALLFWGWVAVLAYFHVAVSAKVLGVLLIAEVLVVLFFDIIVMSSGGAEGISMQPFTWSAYSSGNLGVALIFAVALFSGFEATAIYREETRDPDRTIPRATLMVVLFIGLFYMLSAWSLITAIGPSKAVALAQAHPSEIFFAVARQFGGEGYYQLVAALILTSMFAADLSIHNVTTRYVYSLSVDGILPRIFGVAHTRHKSPHRASIAVSMTYFAGSAILLLVGLTGEQIYAWFAGMAAFGLICAMTITSLATIIYFRRHPHDVSSWSGMIAPGLSLLGLTTFVILGYHNFPALIGGSRLLANVMTVIFAVVFMGGVGYALKLRNHRPDIYQRIGRQ